MNRRGFLSFLAAAPIVSRLPILRGLAAFAATTPAISAAKVAGIVTLTDELLAFSSPSAEELVRAELIRGLNAHFIEYLRPTTILSRGFRQLL